MQEREARDQLQRVEARIADLKARMPAHTPRPAMLMELEDLEEEAAQLRSELSRKDTGDAEGAA